ncbi:hypothetical protein [Methylocystis echinoides]|uniref:Uncharacterized protein n=1 Tax=Methylocystis echinoides TaxID=29468 RepID=A0A9W6LSH7_9HYPH|nr:hypothetical protein [Methylocystis echinoides]GLI93593.1 hypothetical protein LMG27198_25850 [Methylocystis echinoides]
MGSPNYRHFLQEAQRNIEVGRLLDAERLLIHAAGAIGDYPEKTRILGWAQAIRAREHARKVRELSGRAIRLTPEPPPVDLAGLGTMAPEGRA